MDETLVKALDEAWAKVGRRVMEEPGELERRRGRRRKGIMTRPQRAWCLGVRAGDTRMTGMDFEMVPDRPQAWDHEANCWRYREHTVVLESRLLRWICRPVSIPFPGVTSRELAGMLGVNRVAVNAAMKRGMFSIRYVAGLGGVKGPPVPILMVQGLLDPAGIPLGKMADVEWGSVWRWVSEHVPDGIRQTLTRRPVFRPCKGEMVFRGWRWVCPGCGGNAHVVFYPLAAMHVARFVERVRRWTAKTGVDVEVAGSGDEVEAPPPCFACSTCHGVHDRGRVSSAGWNELVAQLSGGLLYGHEVERPAWYVSKRKRAFHRIAGRKPSGAKAEVEKLLVETELKYREVAERLGVGLGFVQGAVGRIYRERGVHGRGELRGNDER